MIGAKTLVTLTLLTAGLAAALAFGVLSPERLVSRGWGTLFLVGGFSFVVGTLMFRFWRLGEKSRHYFRWSTDTTQWNTAAEAHFLGGEKRRITLGDTPRPAATSRIFVYVDKGTLADTTTIDSPTGGGGNSGTGASRSYVMSPRATASAAASVAASSR